MKIVGDGFAVPKKLRKRNIPEICKKICALPDVLKKVEYRINQLKRIIDGAGNARDNGVISKNRKKNIVNDTEDIIEEYLDVARGEKTLSKVSEVKANYVVETGDKNSTVEEIQQKLYNLGYTSQFVSGYYGDITFNNVAYFQIVNDLDVTGWVDSDTYDTLFYEEEEEIAASVPEEVELEELEWVEVENEDDWKDYLLSSGKQVILGNYTEDVTVLGTTAQIGMGLLGVDILADARDISADFVNWEFTWPHFGQTVVDIIAIVPIIGGVKFFDEATVLIKNGDEVLAVTKHADEVADAGKVVKVNPYDLIATHSQTLSKTQFNKLLNDIRENGIQEAIKFVEYNGQKYVVDGHHRLLAAKNLGLKEVPVQKVELPYAGYKTVDDLLWYE